MPEFEPNGGQRIIARAAMDAWSNREPGEIRRGFMVPPRWRPTAYEAVMYGTVEKKGDAIFQIDFGDEHFMLISGDFYREDEKTVVESCEGCRFMRRTRYSEVASCHRNPPPWQEVAEVDWCGEFEKKT